MPKLLRIEESLAYQVYRLSRLLRKHLVALASQHGFDLTPEQWFVLNKLRHRDGQTQTELCEALGDKPNMTRILATMSDKDLVARGDDPVDRRKSRVYLTRLGRKTHDDFARFVEKDRREVFAGLSERDMQQAMQVLAAVEQNLE